MTLPESVRREVEAVLGAPVARGARVGGGCVSLAARVETGRGDVAFLKWGGSGEPVGVFAAEADSLRALAGVGAVRVPSVLGVSDAGAGAGWLLLEWLEPGAAGPGSWARLGEGLAELHRAGAGTYGWAADNFIGPLPQANGAFGDWAAFWRERRLLPQLERSYEAGYFGAGERRGFRRLLDGLEESLAGAGEVGPSLLHGDLWSGNVHMMADGTPALVDPSSYRGHREVDLAMSELFGGFDARFHEAYRAAWPVAPEYASVRRPIYQLYYLLVHVNLFGGGYVGQTLAALDRALEPGGSRR